VRRGCDVANSDWSSFLLHPSAHPRDPLLKEVGDDRACVDHDSANGPNRIETASRPNPAIQAVSLAGPPAASSTMPKPHAPAADNPNPTVECSAIVEPRCSGAADMVMPDVSAPESAGTVNAYTNNRPSSTHGENPMQRPIATATAAEPSIT